MMMLVLACFTWVDIVTGSHLALCVDDEQVALRARRLVLERAGYQVLTAETGEEGLAVFREEAIDAVIFDYSMPGMHGGEVATQMGCTKPTVPIMLLSAYPGLPDKVTQLVDVYMTKGEGAPALLDRLRLLLREA